MNHLSTLVFPSLTIQYHGNEPFSHIKFLECEQMVAYFSSAVININKKILQQQGNSRLYHPYLYTML